MGLIFNVGARRSGTYWLQRIVCAHPDVGEVPSETHLFSHGVAPLMDRFQHSDPGSPEVGKVHADREVVIRHLRALTAEVLGAFGSLHVAERTPLHVQHLPLIAELHPDARFVHIIRDGRDAVRSLVAQEWGPATVAEAAAEWRASVTAGRVAGAELGERYAEVRYEALLASPRPEIERIYAHLGLSGSVDAAVAAAGEVVNLGPHDARVGAGKWREGWKRRELRDFERVAGDLLRDLGYS